MPRATTALRSAAAASAVVALAVACSQPASSPAAASGRTRHYVISADEVVWDYAPSSRDGITGKPFDADAAVFVRPGPDRIGSRYRKCVFREYADAGFRALKPRDASDAYLGLLGPVLRAEVGDRIEVTFRNACSIPSGLHPHGVRYAKDSEGADYVDGSREQMDGSVSPGGHRTYRWDVPERSGPGPMDGSSVLWMYHSHADEVGDVYAGLMGPIVVTARGKARADGSPKDVDRELFVDFTVMDENASPYLDQARAVLARPPAADDEGFVESNLMHAVNGYVYGTGPVPEVRAGERVRWYLMAMGTEVDLHTPHWHGNTVTALGMRTDVVSLLPAGMVTADMTPDAVGTWLLHCHVGDHIAAGMATRYRVLPGR